MLCFCCCAVTAEFIYRVSLCINAECLVVDVENVGEFVSRTAVQGGWVLRKTRYLFVGWLGFE